MKNFKKVLGYLLLCGAMIWILSGSLFITFAFGIDNDGPTPTEWIISLLAVSILPIIMVSFGSKMIEQIHIFGYFLFFVITIWIFTAIQIITIRVPRFEILNKEWVLSFAVIFIAILVMARYGIRIGQLKIQSLKNNIGFSIIGISMIWFVGTLIDLSDELHWKIIELGVPIIIAGYGVKLTKQRKENTETNSQQ